jgi:hypothetical protein
MLPPMLEGILRKPCGMNNQMGYPKKKPSDGSEYALPQTAARTDRL